MINKTYIFSLFPLVLWYYLRSISEHNIIKQDISYNNTANITLCIQITSKKITKAIIFPDENKTFEEYSNNLFYSSIKYIDPESAQDILTELLKQNCSTYKVSELSSGMLCIGGCPINKCILSNTIYISDQKYEIIMKLLFYISLILLVIYREHVSLFLQYILLEVVISLTDQRFLSYIKLILYTF